MKKYLRVAFILVMTAIPALAADESLPQWAYPSGTGNKPAAAAEPGPGVFRVPNSVLALTRLQVDANYDVPDWHPDNHPPAPEVVLRGRKPGVEACAHCHLPNGQGGLMQAASLAGLSAEYIIKQMADFKDGTRKSASPKYTVGNIMQFLAKTMTADEIKSAADYFASVAPRPWIKVIKSTTAPKIAAWNGMYVAAEDTAMEPLGDRIVELPEDTGRTRLRDSEAGYVAYVPPGSIQRGEALATTGANGANGATTPCAICHGAGLKGMGPVPSLAGRSPTYTARQLSDMKQGTRAGTWSVLMKSVVAKLSPADMMAIAAYTSSLAP